MPVWDELEPAAFPEPEASLSGLEKDLLMAKKVVTRVFGDSPLAEAALPQVIAEVLEVDYADDLTDWSAP